MANDLVEKKKSFWERPEGTTGMLTLAAGGVGLWFAAPALLAFVATLTALVGQTIMLVIMGAILFAILSVLSNKKFRVLISYLFKSVMRQVTGAFVEIDPIGIMKSYVEELQKKRQVMADSRDQLKGQLKVLDRQIQMNDDEYQQAMATASIANKQGNAMVFQTNANQAGRLDKLNKTSLIPLQQQLQTHLRALDKYYDVTGGVIIDLSNEVKAREIERKMVLSSHTAMKAAKQIINGGTDSRELFDTAMEKVVEDFGMKMGDIDSFIENSKGFVDGLDIQNGVYQADALKKLQEWESKPDSILLGNDKAKMLEQQNITSPLFNQIGVPTSGSMDYEHLLRK